MYTNSQSYWSSKFPSKEIDWNICFKGNFVNPLLPRKCKDFYWKTFYGLVNTKVRLKRMEISTGCCCICKNGDENLEHLSYFCNGITLVWNELEKIMRSVSNVEIELNHVLVGSLQNEQNNFIINVLLSISRWEIWKRRNHIRYNDGDFPIKKLTVKIKWELKTHLQQLARDKQLCIVNQILDVLWIMTIE